MTAADDAFAAAERLIAEAKRTGAESLSFFTKETLALTRLPESIVGLDKLTKLYLDNTHISDLRSLPGHRGLQVLSLRNTRVTELTMLGAQDRLRELSFNNTRVTDLSKIANLRRLERLSFNKAPVTDLTPLAGLTGLRSLGLIGTQVSNLTPLMGLINLVALGLNDTQVSDISPLAGLIGLGALGLSNTQVNDLTPLAALTGMGTLRLSYTKVLDLRPLLWMRRLLEPSPGAGLSFKGIPAAQDPRIAEIAALKDAKSRAAALFALLEAGWEPPGVVDDQPFWRGDDEPFWSDDDSARFWREKEPPTLPKRLPAPLEVEVYEGRLVMESGSAGLPISDANTRAEQGWHALMDYRKSFGESFNIGNHAPLPSVLRSFDRALGDVYDPNRQIALGMHGQRIIGLAFDADFVANLPIGAETELKGFAAAVATLVNRFPDWILYQEEAEAAEPAAQKAAQERSSFMELDAVIEESANADAEVKAEYHDEVVAGTETGAGEAAAKGLVASTSEVARVLLETGIAEVMSGKAARGFGIQMEDMHGKEFPKILYYSGGFVLPMLSRMSRPLRRLAKRYPNRMGFVVAALDYLFGPGDGA